MYTRKYSRKPRRNEQKVRNLVVTIITSIDDEEKKRRNLIVLTCPILSSFL
jgi:hypothetical protein